MSDSPADSERGQVQLSVRVPRDLHRALERVAESEDRTVSAELRRIIRRHVTESCEHRNHVQEGPA
jgi:hypothetical protein